MAPIKKFFRILGPGLITGVADDDPSGIATYSQTGAQFGYAQLWTIIFLLPLMIAIQEACGRIGAVKGHGIAAVIKKSYGKKILFPVLFLILIANIINIGADIGAMAAAMQLVLPINFVITTLAFTCLILSLQIFVNYQKYINVLKWLCIFIFAYPITVCIISPPWWTLLKATFIPDIKFNFQYLFIITGVLGTTISPYMFFWQASQEVEEAHARKAISMYGVPRITKKYINKLRLDTFLGMILSQICAWSIIVVTATILNQNGITDIKTAADAAKALEPFVRSFAHAGFISKLIFASGIIGLGLISVPVLAGSAAYAMSEAFDWNKGLNLKFKSAQRFYGVIIAATVIGLLLNFLNIDPMRALVYSAVLNGIVAVPLIFIIAVVARNEKIMGRYKSGWLSNTFVWFTFVGMLAASIAMFFSLGK